MILNGSYNINFTMDLAWDLGFATKFGREFGAAGTGGPGGQTFIRARSQYGSQAWSSQVVKLLEDAVGTDLRAPGFRRSWKLPEIDIGPTFSGLRQQSREPRNMRITRISAYQVDLPLHEGTYRWSGGNSVTVFDSTIIAVETDAGLSPATVKSVRWGPAYLPAYAEKGAHGPKEISPRDRPSTPKSRHPERADGCGAARPSFT